MMRARAPRRRLAAGLLHVALLVAATPGVAAGALDAVAQQEIDALLAAVATADCRFQRNGRWHDAAEARTHLQRKFDYLRKRNRIASAEDFIALAGTGSSLSGRAYSMQCEGAPETPSAAWLGEQLQRTRSARTADGQPLGD